MSRAGRGSCGRLTINALFLGFATLLALQLGHAWAQWYEVEAPGVRVLFQDPAVESYAQEVAGRSLHALNALGELFGSDPPPVTIELDARTDLYGAIAPPLPRSRVAMPALFPAAAQADLRTRDPLLELLLHELTHSVQLSYLQRPPEVPQLARFGLVGEAVAPLPPGWLLEGLAVWVAESLSAQVGDDAAARSYLFDARTLGVLHTLALEGEWPSLADVSLLSHSAWPGGEARYLLGGAFVAHLVGEHGWESLLVALQHANAGWYPLSFAEAWRRASGTDLREEWRRWEQKVRDEAAIRASTMAPDGAASLTDSGEVTTILAISPRGDRLAWRPPSGGVLVSRLSPFGLVDTRRVLSATLYPESLTWLGEGKLVYSRMVAGSNERFTDLFEFDLNSGKEVRLTHGERPRLARAGSDGCVWYVRDVVGEASHLRRLCPGVAPQQLFVAPEGMHIVGLALGNRGRIALSLWRHGFVDLALLEGDRLHWLTQDAAQELDPVWWAEDLLFRSDRGPVFELYALRLGEREIRQLTDSLGGVFAPSAAGDRLLFARLSARGYELAELAVARPVARLQLETEAVPDGVDYGGPYPVRVYRPGASLLPYGWLPQLSVSSLSPLVVSSSVAILGQDDSGDHSYELRVGYDPRLDGPLPGTWASFGYAYRSVDVLDLFQRPPPVSFGVRLGAWPWPLAQDSGSERAIGAIAELRWREPVGDWAGAARVAIGLVHLPSHGGVQPDARVDLALSQRRNDLWGYGVRGGRVSLHAHWRADRSGGFPATWVDASTVLPVDAAAPFTAELTVRAGLRPPAPVPLNVPAAAAFAAASLHDSFTLGWRYGDGLFALERLTAQGRVHLFYEGSLGTGFDMSLWADAMVRYGAPVSVGGSVGYARGWWYRLGVRLPL